MKVWQYSFMVGILQAASLLAAQESPPRYTSASHSCAMTRACDRRSVYRGWLATLISIYPVLEHEHLAVCRGNLAQELL